jgi:hypothetical protein
MNKNRPITFSVSVLVDGELSPKILTFESASSVTADKLKEILNATEIYLQDGDSSVNIKSDKDIENLRNGSVLKIVKQKKPKKEEDKKDKKAKSKILNQSNQSFITDSPRPRSPESSVFGISIERLVCILYSHLL